MTTLLYFSSGHGLKRSQSKPLGIATESCGGYPRASCWFLLAIEQYWIALTAFAAHLLCLINHRVVLFSRAKSCIEWWMPHSTGVSRRAGTRAYIAARFP